MGLDFSKLDKLAYRGFETAEARAEKDALIEQGFTILEEPTPFDTPVAPTTPPQAAQTDTGKTGNPSAGTAQTAPQGATERARRSFTAPTDPARDYRAMYAALFRFHERHNPPTIGEDNGDGYWTATTDDMQATAQLFNGDPFMVNLLCIVFEELEREYQALKKQAAGYMPD